MPTFRNTLPFHGLPRHAPYLLHIPARGLHVGRYLPQPFYVLRPAPTLSPFFLLAQAILEPKLSPYKMSYILNLVILHIYPPMKMEQTECSETSAYKIQTPGNYPEESIQHSEQGESLKLITKSMITRNSSLLFFKNVQNCKESCDLNVKDQSEAFSLTSGIVLRNSSSLWCSLHDSLPCRRICLTSTALNELYVGAPMC